MNVCKTLVSRDLIRDFVWADDARPYYDLFYSDDESDLSLLGEILLATRSVDSLWWTNYLSSPMYKGVE